MTSDDRTPTPMASAPTPESPLTRVGIGEVKLATRVPAGAIRDHLDAT